MFCFVYLGGGYLYRSVAEYRREALDTIMEVFGVAEWDLSFVGSYTMINLWLADGRTMARESIMRSKIDYKHIEAMDKLIWEAVEIKIDKGG